MLYLKKPDTDEVRAFIERRRNSEFSYAAVGASAGAAPEGYNVDHNRCLLGRGVEDFERAKNAIRQWKMFDLSWVEAFPPAAIEAGAVAAILVRHFGIWSLNACRIVYVFDEQESPIERFGFAYGTLAEHAESGEERFTIEYDPGSGEVCYDLYAFSRPNQWFAKIGYSAARRLQREFAAGSLAAMIRDTSSFK
ncbi:MAG: DUF1990 domain-containing protein [Acidobacteriota bacterium]